MVFITRLMVFLSIVPLGLFSEEYSPKICLTMIVKNESKIIERCLGKTLGIVDYVCVCDTGSSDNTVQIVEDFLKEHKISGKVYRHQWKNFGHNRTLSVMAAKKMLYEYQEPLDKVYLLLLDADMMLEVTSNFDKRQLALGSYLLKQKNGFISYDNVRLIKASIPWRCVGPTHEYWSPGAPCIQSRLDSLWIDDRNDGGCKSDKFERDVRLLTQGLIDEPNNPRYMFYLAQSYMCLQKYTEAISWYKKRINCGGLEEVWYSKYMIGDCYKALQNWDSALKWYLEAYSTRPSRAEPLRKISEYYLKHDKYELAYLFAKKGRSIPYPSSDFLFVADSIYNYELDEDLSIAGYYCSLGKEDGLAATDRLICKRTTPETIRENAYRNLRYYLKPLENVHFKPLKILLPKISSSSAQTYQPTNPSILTIADGYLVLVRSVNYRQEKGNYTPLDPSDPLVRTRNFLVKYTKDWKMVWQKEILEKVPRQTFSEAQVLGLEDCRLIAPYKEGEVLRLLATACDMDKSVYAQQTLCELQEEGECFSLTKCTPLLSPHKAYCEKNWLPFYHKNKLCVVYSHAPFEIYSLDEVTGECSSFVSYMPQSRFENFRGSASPIPFDEGYLLLEHEVIFPREKERIYAHRFVFLDKQCKIHKITKPFTFQHTGVEFSCGMTLNHEKDQILIGCGIEDKEAYVLTIPVAKVRAMLYPVA
jgi:glycosyltransferase involved in cell wall biosynthesis